MRMLAGWLRRLADWCDPPRLMPGKKRLEPADRTELEHQADALVAQWDSHDSAGEHKRHQVYAALKKLFPAVPSIEISFAIEEALWRLRGGSV